MRIIFAPTAHFLPRSRGLRRLKVVAALGVVVLATLCKENSTKQDPICSFTKHGSFKYLYKTEKLASIYEQELERAVQNAYAFLKSLLFADMFAIILFGAHNLVSQDLFRMVCNPAELIEQVSTECLSLNDVVHHLSDEPGVVQGQSLELVRVDAAVDKADLAHGVQAQEGVLSWDELAFFIFVSKAVVAFQANAVNAPLYSRRADINKSLGLISTVINITSFFIFTDRTSS